MRRLPEADPGSPDLRSPIRYPLWLASKQRRTLAGGTLFGVLWMLSQALAFGAVGEAIGVGVKTRNVATLLEWTCIVVGLGAVQAFSGRMRHKFAVWNWLVASYRTIQLLGHPVAR